jgi:hypothetical protein
VEALNGKDIEGKELYAGRAQKKTERESTLKAKCGTPSGSHISLKKQI